MTVTRPPAADRKSGKPSRGKPAKQPPRNRTPVAPDRLPRSSRPSSRGGEIGLGLLGWLGLLLLVVGVPAALVLLVGYPLPRTAPSKEWLTTAISATLIIKILACVVWVVWAHFVICLLTEWRAIRRGRLPGHIALGGGSQLLARKLVATALLLVGTATTFSQFASSATSTIGMHGHTVVTAQARQAGAAVAGAINPDGSTTKGVDPERHGMPGGSQTADDLGTQSSQGTKYYVVEPPHGRRYDSLWDIAQRTLGDPLRYKEIFALNKDRLQADGRKLIDANLILPGWQLRLPADASGPGVHTTVPPHPLTRTDPSRPADRGSTAGDIGLNTPGAGHHAARGGSDLAARHDTEKPTATHTDERGGVLRAPATTASSGFSLPLTATGGSLVLAGIMLALTARRGPYSDVQDDVFAGADPARAASLDAALRHLAAARLDQGRSLPYAMLAWASAERVFLFHAGGDSDAPPAPWQPGQDGSSWELALADLPAGPVPDVAAPYPGLLSVGRWEQFELFVDLEQAPGIVSIAGDLGRARDLAFALAVQAITCQWSDGAKITMVGFGGEDLSALDPRSIVQVSRIGDVLPDLEAEHEQLRRLQGQLGVDGVLAGRQSLRSDAWAPQLVLLSGTPSADEAARLQQLAYGRSNVAVIVLGDVPSAPWRFVIDPEGALDLGALGITATAHAFSPEAAAHLVAAMKRADRERLANSERRVEFPALSEPDSGLPAARQRATDGPAVPPVATVRLLGPVSVEAAGPVDEPRRALLTELVVAIALHPDGIADAVLRASVWPRGVGDDVFTATMSAAQAWLGADAAGRPCLSRTDEGAWRIGPGVQVDWLDLVDLVHQPGVENDLPRLARAIDQFSGEAFSATPSGRFGWLSFARAAREARVVGTAVARNAAQIAVAAGHRGEATRLLRRGVTLVPTAEVLWRDLLRLHPSDDPDGAAALAAEIYTVLRAHRIWPEPETDALIAQVAPDFDGNGPTPAAPAIAAS